MSWIPSCKMPALLSLSMSLDSVVIVTGSFPAASEAALSALTKLVFGGLQALVGLDREGRVIYVGTFSGDTGTATLEQLALADFISEGYFDRHLRRTNASNAARRNALVGAVRKEFGERAEVCGANAGLHLLVWLKGKSGGMIADVSHKAEMAGVGLYSVDPFYTKTPRRTGVVLGYAPLRELEIREGIRRLAVALK